MRARTTTVLFALAAVGLSSCDSGAPADVTAAPAPPSAAMATPTGEVGRPIPAGGRSQEAAPPSLAVLDGRLWVLGADGLRRIDTRRERARAATAEAPPYAAVLQPGVGAVWAVDLNGGHVIRFDGSRVRRSKLAQVPARGLAASDTGVWVTTPTAAGARVSRLDTESLRPTASVPLRFPVYQLAAAGGRVWAIDQAHRRLVGLGGPHGKPEANQQLGADPVQVVAAGDWLWVLARDARGRAGTLLRFDPRTGRRVGPALHAKGDVRAIAAEGDRVWTVQAGLLRSFVIHNGRPLGSPVEIGTQPASLERLNGRLWVSDARERTVRRVSPSLPAR